MFSKFFQGELAYLRGMGKAYAEANPTTAGLLAERGGDPDVERLLEGFAFLAARVRERIEDGVPEIVHALTEILLPHYLRPVPACSVVEFLPVPGALRARVRVAAGTELASVPVEGTPCRFRTTADLDLVPASVQEVAMDQAIGATPVVRIQLQTSQQALPALLQPQGLRFFVQGDLPLAATFLLWIARHLRGVQVRGLGPGAAAVSLDPRSVRLPGFDPEMALLPWPRLAPQGYRALQEFYTLPQKFLFFEVRDLQAAAAAAGERFEILLQFDRPPELPARLARETVRLNCVPVANVFRTAADPLSFETLGEEHLLRASEIPPQHMEIYAVESAVGIPEQGPRRPYRAFASFAHGAEGKEGRYYRVRRALSPIDGGLDTWVSVMRPLDAGPGEGAEVLSLEVTATNRSLPAQLKLGEISQPTPSSPTIARFRNVAAVTKPARPPIGTELHWRLLSHLAANRSPLGDPEVLRGLLELYNFQGLTDEQQGRANRLRVEGIARAAESASRRVVGGAPARGSRFELELDEGHFAGLGDAFLFAAAVDELLAFQVKVNAFVETSLKLVPSQRVYGFPPRTGGRPLL
ncbi:MAG TPA: type VI secretion system baseplate subunit TssF [Anaeromyxobacteraceae bacterium]|jgi:type VI secretion system protein ImpG